MRLGTLTGEAVLVGDAATRALLQDKLKSDQFGEVIYALDFMEQLAGDIPVYDLTRLLTHPSPEVRRDVLLRIARRKPDPKTRHAVGLAERRKFHADILGPFDR